LKSNSRRIEKAWLILILLLVAGVATTAAGCGNDTTGAEGELSGSFKIIGSNTLEPLSAVWAEEFMKMHPKVSIAVSGPGSGVGIAALIDGTTDVA